MDTSAGRSTEARGLPRAFPTYDPRDTLAWLCQKHRSCRPDQPSLCSGYHRQETKFIIWPCGETRWPHASRPRIITGRSSKNRLPCWSWLAATARTPARAIHGLMDPADRRRYTTPFSIRGQKWICLRDLMIMMMMILLSTLHNIVCNLVCKPTHFHTLMMYIQYRLTYWLYGPPRIERVGNGNVRLSVSQSYSGPENSVQIRPQFSELLCCLL